MTSLCHTSMLIVQQPEPLSPYAEPCTVSRWGRVAGDTTPNVGKQDNWMQQAGMRSVHLVGVVCLLGRCRQKQYYLVYIGVEPVTDRYSYVNTKYRGTLWADSGKSVEISSGSDESLFRIRSLGMMLCWRKIFHWGEQDPLCVESVHSTSSSWI